MGKKIKVVLLQPVRGLGNAYDVVEVSPHYFAHVLAPKKLAQQATPGLLKKIQERKAQAEQQLQQQKEAFAKMVEELSQEGLLITKKATEGGKLYDKVDEDEIAKLLNQKYGLNLDKKSIKLPHKLETIGIFPVEVSFGDQTAQIKVEIQQQK